MQLGKNLTQTLPKTVACATVSVTVQSPGSVCIIVGIENNTGGIF